MKIGQHISFKNLNGEVLTGIIRDVKINKRTLETKVKINVDFKQYHVWVNVRDVIENLDEKLEMFNFNVFDRDMKVVPRHDESMRCIGYDIVSKAAANKSTPESEVIVCTLPDGVGYDMMTKAKVISESQNMIDLIDQHCEWCADCKWRSNPADDCMFGQFWKRIFSK